MDITLTIPDGKAPDVIAAFKSKYEYQEQVWVDGELVANPESAALFAKRKLIEHIRSITIEYLRWEAIEAISIDFDLE